MPALNKNGAGMNLMAFHCEDLNATIKMMEKNGVRINKSNWSKISSSKIHTWCIDTIG